MGVAHGTEKLMRRQEHNVELVVAVAVREEGGKSCWKWKYL